MTYALGIRENLRPFLEQLLQVFFVGLTIGLQRTVIPALAETEFGVVQGSMTAIFAVIVSFGIVKGALNFVSGRLSERVGRCRVLIWGWLVALPIPFMILWAPSWGWIVAANVLLGVNQGFCWSMTVTAKMDIVKVSERGLATGFNEFAGYGGVALAGLVTGYLASYFDPRMSLFVFGLVVILLALAAGALAFTETLPYARAEAARHKSGTTTGPRPRYVEGPESPTAGQIFALVTWQNRTFMALAQAGSVEKFVDALIAARTTPPINDISTDTEDPPVFWFTATPSDYPVQNAEPQRAAYPEVRPLELPLSVDDAFAAALALVEARGWEVLSADPGEAQIEAIARSRLFGFEDEVAIRVTETDTGARIDMSSRSRLGQIDRGANARRIESFLVDLEARAPN